MTPTYQIKVTVYQYRDIIDACESVGDDHPEEYRSLPAKMRSALAGKRSAKADLTEAELDLLIEQLDWNLYEAKANEYGPTCIARCRRQQAAARKAAAEAGHKPKRDTYNW
jgi:hypothetical protein